MIGLISDTHWPPGSGFTLPARRREREERVKNQIASVFKNIEFIIHAGDVGDESIVAFLEKLAPLYIVRGNRDPRVVAGRVLPEFLVLEYRGLKIGVTHGRGSPKNIIEREIDPVLLPHNPDIIVFGHTHRKFLQWRNGILYVNPGSAGDTFFTKENWIATLEIVDAKPVVEFYPVVIP